MTRNGIDAYTKTQVTTTTNQKELIVLAYDAILRNVSQAREYILAQEVEASYTALIKARAIIAELAGTLNMAEGGVIAQNLWNLYMYFMQQITEVNFSKDVALLDGILPAISELREGWAALEIPKDDAKTAALNRRGQLPEEQSRLSISG